MKISIILCHPSPGSFNHALAQACAESFRSAGHEVLLHDLHAEGFDPVITTAELSRDALLPEQVARHVDEICGADGLIVVHPNYWSRPPAMLCGWTDRVLRPGRAYRFVPDGKGGASPEGLLRLRFALILNTANTDQSKEEALLGDPLEVHWRKVVFALCGAPKVERRVFSPVILSSPEQRAAWLEEARSSSLALARLGG